MSITAEDVAALLQTGLIVWLSVLAGFVFYAVLLRGRALTRMLTLDDGRFAAERVGTLAIILAVAGYYLLTAGSADPVYDEATKTYWMPDIPESLLVLLAGGKSVFLAGKMTRTNDRRST